jgi:hypothetical protein
MKAGIPTLLLLLALLASGTSTVLGFRTSQRKLLAAEWPFPIPRSDCICPHVFAPVCGADGGQYGNSCEAYCAGTEVVSRGGGDCRAIAAAAKARGSPSPRPQATALTQTASPDSTGAGSLNAGKRKL